jgi:hypothetical protein
MRHERAPGVLGLSCLALLGFVKTLPAQTPENAWQFKVMRLADAGHFTPYVGLITITSTTLAFDSTDTKHSFEVPLNEIAGVTGHTKLKRATIKLKNGRTHNFLSLNEKGAIEPLVEAIAEAMSGRPGPPLPQSPQAPTQPKPNFAPIPSPPPPVDAPGASARIVFGQTPDQVKAILGEPDRTHIDVDRQGGFVVKIHKVVWYYKNLTVTFVDGRVSVVEQEKSI